MTREITETRNKENSLHLVEDYEMQVLFQPANSVLSLRHVCLLMNVFFFIFWLTCSAGVMYIQLLYNI